MHESFSIHDDHGVKGPRNIHYGEILDQNLHDHLHQGGIVSSDPNHSDNHLHHAHKNDIRAHNMSHNRNHPIHHNLSLHDQHSGNLNLHNNHPDTLHDLFQIDFRNRKRRLRPLRRLQHMQLRGHDDANKLYHDQHALSLHLHSHLDPDPDSDVGKHRNH